MIHRHGTGAKPSYPDKRDFGFCALGLDSSDGAELASDMSGHVRLIRDQKRTNTCGGQAFAAAVDLITHQSDHASDYGPMSALFLYHMAVRLWLVPNEPMLDDGIDARSVVRVLRAQGICDDAHWPFDPKRVLVTPNWNAIYRAAPRAGCSYAFLRQTGLARINELGASLNAGHPVIVALNLTSDFFSVSDDRIIDPPESDDTIAGRHFVVLVGRDPIRHVFKLLNSWGTDWGVNGFGFLSDEYLMSEHCWDPTVIYGFARVMKDAI